jgi:Delta24(24(1))-sterol reductase
MHTLQLLFCENTDWIERKTEHEGFVETPRIRKARRKSQMAEEDSYDSSSTTDNAPKSSIRARTPSRRSKLNGEAMNGHSTSNGSASNGPAINDYTKAKNLIKEQELGAFKNRKVVDGWCEGLDPKVNYSGTVDFGGSFGVSAMMVGFPLLMYYMWIGATYYDGKFPTPEEDQSFIDFAKHMGDLVYTGAYPSLKAWTIYWSFGVFEMACYCLLPGIYTYGKPLPHEGGKQMKYYCSGVWSFYITILVVAALHFTDVFPLYTILDEFGPLMSVAIISGWLVSIVAYFSALYRGAQHRMTGYPIYDFFMGAELNPRMFGILDLKMFFEVRLPWYILFLVSCAAAARQYEQFGYVSGEVGFLVMAHFLYANACSKGEECIVNTWYA